MVKIKNDSNVNLKITEKITKETILPPGTELDLDPDTTEVSMDTES